MIRLNLEENIRMALTAVVANKLRSFLTLVGIIAGVASIIAVMTAIQILRTKMENDMSQLGSNTFQVQKWPAIGGGGQNWRKIMKRKPLTVEQANLVREKAKGVELVGAEVWEFAQVISHGDFKTNNNVGLAGATPEYQYNNNHMIAYGRFISDEDVKVGRRVIVLGSKVVNKIFPFKDPLDQVVKVAGQKYTVIGVFEELGETMFGSGDNNACIPITTFIDQFGLKDNRGFDRSVNITVKIKDGFDMNDVMEEVRGILRVARKVKPLEEDDFDMYSNDSVIKAFNEMTAIIRIVAIVMGAIALIVAGIGIMNIMLVSVTERTKEIGIRKSVGAKRKDILAQFLTEAVLLCQIGGLIGIAVGIGIGNIVSLLLDVSVKVPWDWVFVGLIFCSLIGIIFGLWPAAKAAKMDPIESLRYE